jgi:hypothetical protein
MVLSNMKPWSRDHMLFMIEISHSMEADVPVKQKIDSVTFMRLATKIFFSKKSLKT